MSIVTAVHLSPAEVARYREAGYHFPVRVMSAAQAGDYMAKLAVHEAKYGRSRVPCDTRRICTSPGSTK
jgi:hypothetical protein